MPNGIKSRTRFSSLSLSLSLSLLLVAVFATSLFLVPTFSFAQSSNDAVPSNLDGVTWNAEYTVCTLGPTQSGNPVDGSALQAEIANHIYTIKTFKTETGAQLEGSVASLFYTCKTLETADFSDSVAKVGVRST